MSSSTPQPQNLAPDFDFRVLFHEDSILDTYKSNEIPDEVSINSVSTSVGGSNSSTSSDAPSEMCVMDNLNDLERLLTRINLMTGRNTAYPRPTTRQLTKSSPTISTMNLAYSTQLTLLPKTSRNISFPTLPSVRKTTWLSLPTEIRLKIYHDYFRNTHYTIHDSSPATICSTRPVSAFWRDPTSPSRNVYSSHINLFLTSHDIIHTAHPIWLAISTFSFGDCIVRDPRTVLRQMKLPRSLLRQVKIFEADKAKVIQLVKILGEWNQRMGSADGVGTGPVLDEVPFVLHCRGDPVDFPTLEMIMEMYQADLYGMRIEYVDGPAEMGSGKPGLVRIDGVSVDPS